MMCKKVLIEGISRFFHSRWPLFESQTVGPDRGLITSTETTQQQQEERRKKIDLRLNSNSNSTQLISQACIYIIVR